MNILLKILIFAVAMFFILGATVTIENYINTGVKQQYNQGFRDGFNAEHFWQGL